MARQFFKDLPDTTTPLTASRLNGLLDGEEALGNVVVDSIRSKNMFSLSNFENNGTERTTYTINNDSLTITTISSGTYRYVKKKIQNLIIGKTYTIKIGEYTDTSSGGLAQWGVTNNGGTYYDSLKILSQSQSISFIPTETSAEFRAGYLTNSCTSGDTLTIGKIQLEDGGATPYSPYQNLDIQVSKDDLYYKPQDQFKMIELFSCGGCVTGGGTEIHFGIIFPKSMNRINTISINELVMYVRSINGSYIINGTNVIADSEFTTTHIKCYDNMIRVIVKKNISFGVTNNTPVNVQFRTTITFS